MAGGYINLGAGKWRGQWISKQELVEYLRCPYRIFLSFLTGIPIPDMKESALLQLILEKGLEFESGVMEDVEPEEVHSKEAIEPLATKSLIIRSSAIFRNHELGIQGVPDLISTDRGRLLPIEIKNHKTVTELDELELAFYWLLLDPLRKRRTKPKGYIILNTGEVREVNLARERLWDVQFHLNNLRETLETGAEPVLSHECKQCGLSRDCHQKLVESGHLSIIYNVSYARERQFKDIGIDSISKLMRADEEEVNSKLISRFGNTPGITEIFRMKCHAFSISSGKPFFFGDRQQACTLASLPLLAFDLEYDPEGLIWLVGVAIRKGYRAVYQQFFAEKLNTEEERQILDCLINLTEKNRSCLLVTYSGVTADIPQLRKAWLRQNLPDHELSGLVERHMDVCQFLKENFRFPMKSLDLPSIERYVGIERRSGISSGLEALALYRKYLRTKDDALKQQLLNYNREDIESTLTIVDKIPELVAESLTI